MWSLDEQPYHFLIGKVGERFDFVAQFNPSAAGEVLETASRVIGGAWFPGNAASRSNSGTALVTLCWPL